MYWRRCYRAKDGRRHAYWALVKSVRTAKGPRQEVVAYLGERALAAHDAPGWLIVRTAWLYGRSGASFPRTIVERGRARQPLKVVRDQVGSPTHTVDLAAGVLDLVDHGAQGIFHLTNAGETNWYELAKATLAEFGVAADVTPITAAEWKNMRPESAVRPAYSVLDLSGYEKLTGRPMRDWQLALRSFRDAVLEAGGF